MCPGQVMEEIRAKSSAAEALIEELMEENEELKREMRQMVEEMDELQDNFRLDWSDILMDSMQVLLALHCTGAGHQQQK